MTKYRLMIISLLTAGLLGCSLSASLTPPAAPIPTPDPTATPTPAPTPAIAPTISTDDIVRQVIDKLLAQRLLDNPAAVVDALGRDLAEQRIIDVYQRVSPSVVNITTQVLQRNFFFEPVPSEGAGSGFVLDVQGHIVTNFHVVRDAHQIEVTFFNETTLPAKLIGADPRNDIAVLQVEAPPHLLVPVELGDSDRLQVGQRAIVIGNPFGQFGETLTTGVVSALNRSIESQDGRQISGIIQTDAAINKGNSGGPLLDSMGQVIGINSAIFSPSGTNAGVGFAIPVNTLHRILPDLLTLGYYRHPWLGVRYAYKVTPGLSDVLDLPVRQGLLLVEVYPNSPLDKSKVQGAQKEVIVGNQRIFIGGDVLASIDGQPVTSLEDLQTLLETEHAVGDSVEVTIIRNGQEITLPLQLGEEPTR